MMHKVDEFKQNRNLSDGQDSSECKWSHEKQYHQLVLFVSVFWQELVSLRGMTTCCSPVFIVIKKSGQCKALSGKRHYLMHMENCY